MADDRFFVSKIGGKRKWGSLSGAIEHVTFLGMDA